MLTQYFFLEAGQLETNHRKPHHGHIVGEGHLLRTKDPFLNSALLGCLSSEKVVCAELPSTHPCVQTGRSRLSAGVFSFSVALVK